MNIPKHICWTIENEAVRSVNASYWRKVRTLARLFSVPVSMLSASDSATIIDGLILSKTELEELHEFRENRIHEQLKNLQELFLKKQVETRYKVITERPFFEAAIELARKQENAWVFAQSSKKLGIPNIVWQLIRDCPIPVYIAKEKDWQTPINILAAIDPSHVNDKSAALDHKILTMATEIAQLCSAQLHVVHCCSPIIMASEHRIQLRLEQIHRELFKETISPFHIDANRAHLVTGEPAEEIEQLCEKLDIDLVIMGAVSRNSIERVFIGSTAEEVLPSIESDILLVKEPPM